MTTPINAVLSQADRRQSQTVKTRICGLIVSIAVFIAFAVVAIKLYMSGGIIITASDPTDPTGIGMAYHRTWKVWNFWFSPVNLEINQKTCGCISNTISGCPISFGRYGTVSLAVTAVGKSPGEFEEKALLRAVRRNSVRNYILRVPGKGFPWLSICPDAIVLPSRTTEAYSVRARVEIPPNIPLDRITLKVSNENAIAAKLSPLLAESGGKPSEPYSRAWLNITVFPQFPADGTEYIGVGIKDFKITTVALFRKHGIDKGDRKGERR